MTRIIDNRTILKKKEEKCHLDDSLAYMNILQNKISYMLQNYVVILGNRPLYM